MREALHYHAVDDGGSVGKDVICNLCRHECRIKPGKRGICAVRENRDGALYSLVYDRVVSLNVDPIEKKPFFHVLPATLSMSIATPGCNMSCSHCQNHSISQSPRTGSIPGRPVSPKAIAEAAEAEGCATIAYTYTEPTIYFELALDVMKEASHRRIKNVWVTNGFMGKGVLDDTQGLMSAANVDVKAFTEDFYKKVCKARLAPVLENVERMWKSGVWVEVTTLVIPGYNDDEKELFDLASWLAGLDPNIPWHVSRFHPDNDLLNAPPTPSKTLAMARDMGRKAGLRFVYTGNLWGDEGENTFCHVCGSLLVERYGFAVRKNLIVDGKCPGCGADIPGIWNSP